MSTIFRCLQLFTAFLPCTHFNWRPSYSPHAPVLPSAINNCSPWRGFVFSTGYDGTNNSGLAPRRFESAAPEFLVAFLQRETPPNSGALSAQRADSFRPAENDCGLQRRQPNIKHRRQTKREALMTIRAAITIYGLTRITTGIVFAVLYDYFRHCFCNACLYFREMPLNRIEPDGT